MEKQDHLVPSGLKSLECSKAEMLCHAIGRVWDRRERVEWMMMEAHQQPGVRTRGW